MDCTQLQHAVSQAPIRKVYIGINEDSLQVRAIVVTTNDVGDPPVVPDLLKQISLDEPITSLTGDSAYDTKNVYEACHERHILPIIPPRKRVQMREGEAFLRAMRRSMRAVD